MRLLCLSDIHMHCEYLRRILDRTQGTVDAVVVAGDLTNWGDHADVEQVIGPLAHLPLLTIPGNLDTPDGERFLVNRGYSIHGRARAHQGWTFIGFGGGSADFVGDILYTEAEVLQGLEPLLRAAPAATTVLVTHQPPFDTPIDRIGGLVSQGSKSVRGAIERYRPRYQLCGHIHEAWGEAVIGTTHCYNVAAVKEGRAGILDLASGRFERILIDG